MKDKETPLKLVRLWPKMLPGCYETLDYLKDAKTEGQIDYPDYCELPINAAFTYLVETGESEEVAAAGAPELTACYLWRKNKIIFAFDPELTTTLAEQAKETEETDILPADLLLHPPYPIIYIKAPGLVEDIDGFFYWVDYDTNHGTIELRIQWVISDFKMSFGQVMHLLPGSTIHDCVWDTIERTKEYLGEPAIIEAKPVTEIAGMVITALQFVLYLCASNADIREDPPEVHIPDSERHKKVMTIQDKAREVKSFSVGIRIGAAIRKAQRKPPADPDAEKGTGSAKRPHSRRGHWHHYWTGPKDGDRKLVLKWTAPTFIHADDIDDNIITFHPVKE
jgi:hypothetical protein